MDPIYELWYAILIPSIIGTIMSSFVVYILLFFKKLRAKPVFLMILQSTIYDLGNNFVYFVPPSHVALSENKNENKNDIISNCKIQGFFNVWMGMAALLSTFLIIICMTIIVNGRVLKSQDIKYYAMINFWVSLSLATLPTFYDMYGESGPWCFIKTTGSGSHHDVYWKIGVFYGELWFYTISMIIMYIFIFWKVKKITDATKNSLTSSSSSSSFSRPSSAQSNSTKKIFKSIRRLRFYPITIVISYTFATVNRVWPVFSSTTPPHWIPLLHSILQNSPSIVNPIIFMAQSAVCKALLDHSNEILEKKIEYKHYEFTYFEEINNNIMEILLKFSLLIKLKKRPIKLLEEKNNDLRLKYQLSRRFNTNQELSMTDLSKAEKTKFDNPLNNG